MLDTIKDRQDGSDKCAHETFKIAIFSSEQFMVKNNFIQVMVRIMGLFAVCRIYFEHEIDLPLNT